MHPALVSVASTLGATAAFFIGRTWLLSRGMVRALRAEFERVEHGRAWRARQPDGPDVDVDALTAEWLGRLGAQHPAIVDEESPL